MSSRQIGAGFLRMFRNRGVGNRRAVNWCQQDDALIYPFKSICVSGKLPYNGLSDK
jgi:hypothetical protein